MNETNVEPIIIPEKPNRLVKVLVSLLMIFDGLSILALGILFFFIAALADPVDFSVEIKDANFLKGQIGAMIGFAYFLLTIISTVFWNVRYGIWRFIMLGLGILHLPVSLLLILAREDFYNTPAVLLYIPLFLDVILCVLIFFGKKRRRLG